MTPDLSPSSEAAIEQVRWWIRSGFTQAEALKAMGAVYEPADPWIKASWALVLRTAATVHRRTLCGG